MSYEKKQYQLKKNDELGIAELEGHPDQYTYINFITYNLSDQDWLHGKNSINVKQAIAFFQSKLKWAEENNNGYLMLDNRLSKGKVFTTWTNYVKKQELTNEQHMADREQSATNDDMPF